MLLACAFFFLLGALIALCTWLLRHCWPSGVFPQYLDNVSGWRVAQVRLVGMPILTMEQTLNGNRITGARYVQGSSGDSPLQSITRDERWMLDPRTSWQTSSNSHPPLIVYSCIRCCLIRSSPTLDTIQDQLLAHGFHCAMTISQCKYLT
jgi:hypothetical protein